MTTTETTTSQGLRAHLRQLLPRSALFHVHVQIHQISSVPLVHGQFGVRWKFRHVKSSTGASVNVDKLDQGKAGLVSGTASLKKASKGKGKSVVSVEEDGGLVSGKARLASSFVSDHDYGTNGIPSVVVSSTGSMDSRNTSSVSFTPPPPLLMLPRSVSGSSAASSLSYPSSSSTGSQDTNDNLESHDQTPTRSTSSSSSSSPAPTPTYSPARGITAYYKLTEHAVTWEHSLDVIVKLDIDRETSELQSNVLKLVVMQRVIPGDPDAPQNPRLGAVYLDLAQYAGVGEAVTRRYLLRKSKTNATLKLTTEVTFISGHSDYIAPPLPKGEIMNGVAGLLDSDVYRTRPRALELWGPYYNKEELEMDLLGGASIPDPNHPHSKHRHRNRSRSRMRDGEAHQRQHPHHHHHHGQGEGSPGDSEDDVYHDASGTSGSDTDEDEGRYEVPFEVSRLPLAYGPKTTEILIEALFNPVKVVKPVEQIDKERESPFELFVDAEKEKVRREKRRQEREKEKAEQVGGLGLDRDRDRTIGRRSGYGTGSGTAGEVSSVYSMEDGTSSLGHNSAGEHSLKGSGSTGSTDENGEGRGGLARAWWSRKKNGIMSTPLLHSRPTTPAMVAASAR
ncbi:hypothetical protein E1B28_006637 [Marasmius oreades]|uniref:C2 NT-type domain-containing protein n=1 Tax=Marasmius oreades TaxID=181124 RepID=A0A9P8AAR2_9AGAR|nr:uncharacterized protein E1B28_006637 [Marasmius oreades]KAG7095953.1 hypothetical protein E1B28_006637 [Marasmius oreades]